MAQSGQLDQNDGESDRLTKIIKWVSDHGQSLDWIFDGDPGGMICGLAERSPLPPEKKAPALTLMPSE